MPKVLIFERLVRPVKGYSFSRLEDRHVTHELKDLIEEQEGDNEEMKHNANGKDKHNSANIILMKVQPERSNDPNQTYIIGGYASDQWKANNSAGGNETCFLFNLTQNLRFNIRKGAEFYQKTQIVDT